MEYSPQKIEDHCEELKKFESSTGKIAYFDGGAGPVILLIHGIPTNSWLYRDLVTPLTEAGYRVIIPDMLGFGHSDKPKLRSSYSPEMHSQRLVELMDDLQIDKFSMVVHDAGGPWSYHLAMEKSESIQSFIFLNTIIVPEGFHPPMNLKENSLFTKILGELYDSDFFGKIIVNSTLKAGTSKHKMKRQERRGYWYNMNTGTDTAIRYFFTHFDKMREVADTFRAFAQKADWNLGIIWGMEDDILNGHEQIPVLQETVGVQESKIHKLEECAHFIQEEEPILVADAIVKIIKAS